MPTSPTQAERSAAISRLREYIQDPDRVLLRLADIQVLLNPNAQALALAAANEELRGELAAARSQIVELEAKVRALASNANSLAESP